MVAEVLTVLGPRPGGRYIDATVGGGGHAAVILQASSPTGWLFGCDRDGEAVEAARHRLLEFAGRFELRQGNYAQLSDWVEPASWDGVLMDLGVSSFQLEAARRGFSFQEDGPLDMRMDPSQALTAAQWINEVDVREMIRIFQELGGEREARRLARAIDAERNRSPFETTGELARLIEREAPRCGQRIHPATRVFQAIRMVVNDEVGSLQRGLAAVLKILKVNGRLAVITFHSGEDRVVKEFGRRLSRDYTVPGEVDIPELRRPCVPQVKWVYRKALVPSDEETRENPRSRSAQLRVFEKIHGA
jgi:16S rRNA (cytosine1402-N4)-methyltransferase